MWEALYSPKDVKRPKAIEDTMRQKLQRLEHYVSISVRPQETGDIPEVLILFSSYFYIRLYILCLDTLDNVQ